MGWRQKDGGVTVVSWVDVIRPCCQKPSTCVRSCAYRTGMKMYWLLCDNVWTVCSIRCVILNCTVIQSPPSTSCKCSSPCCEREYQRLFQSPPPPLFIYCLCVLLHFRDYRGIVHISVFIYLHIYLFFNFFWGCSWFTVLKNLQDLFFFTIY